MRVVGKSGTLKGKINPSCRGQAWDFSHQKPDFKSAWHTRNSTKAAGVPTSSAFVTVAHAGWQFPTPYRLGGVVDCPQSSTASGFVCVYWVSPPSRSTRSTSLRWRASQRSAWQLPARGSDRHVHSHIVSGRRAPCQSRCLVWGLGPPVFFRGGFPH